MARDLRLSVRRQPPLLLSPQTLDGSSRVSGSEFRVQGLGSCVEGLGFWVEALQKFYRVHVLSFGRRFGHGFERVLCFAFRPYKPVFVYPQGHGFSIQGFGEGFRDLQDPPTALNGIQCRSYLWALNCFGSIEVTGCLGTVIWGV